MFLSKVVKRLTYDMLLPAFLDPRIKAELFKLQIFTMCGLDSHVCCQRPLNVGGINEQKFGFGAAPLVEKQTSKAQHIGQAFQEDYLFGIPPPPPAESVAAAAVGTTAIRTVEEAETVCLKNLERFLKEPRKSSVTAV